MSSSQLTLISRRSRHLLLFLWCVIAAVGMIAFWHSGEFAERGIGTAAEDTRADERNDLQVYRQIVAKVREGGNYYEAARGILPNYYQRYNSVFNWRLPTYAYVLAWMGSDSAIRIACLALIVFGLVLNFCAERRVVGIWPACVTVALLFFVLVWVFQDAIYAQEFWAAVLLTISLGAWGIRCRWLAVVSGLAALAFRELMLPYAVVAAGVSWWAGRRREAGIWLAGIGAFFGYLLWHRANVQAQVALLPALDGGSIDQWLKWGGIDFVLLTGRLSNVCLLSVPGGVVFLCLWLAVLGLGALPGDLSRLMLATVLLFWAAFLIIGEPHNFYWGLLYAPMIPFGWVHGLIALYELATGRSFR